MMSAVSVLALTACSATQDEEVSKIQKVTYEYKRDRVQEQIRYNS